MDDSVWWMRVETQGPVARKCAIIRHCPGAVMSYDVTVVFGYVSKEGLNSFMVLCHMAFEADVASYRSPDFSGQNPYVDKESVATLTGKVSEITDEYNELV